MRSYRGSPAAESRSNVAQPAGIVRELQGCPAVSPSRYNIYHASTLEALELRNHPESCALIRPLRFHSKTRQIDVGIREPARFEGCRIAVCYMIANVSEDLLRVSLLVGPKLKRLA